MKPATPRERPILFTGPMVRAILDGQKSQTRRVVRALPNGLRPNCFIGSNGGGWTFTAGDRGGDAHSIRCPFGAVGGVLWVRERWTVVDHDFGTPPTAWLLMSPGGGAEAGADIWCANPPEAEFQKWAQRFGTADVHGGPDPRSRHAMFMPRWASRLTLEVLSVRVERLQEISEEDARAEGVATAMWMTDVPCRAAPLMSPENYRAGFAIAWAHINRKRAPWESNPFVWVIEFRRVEP